MRQVQFNARCYPKDLKLLRQAAAESGMSLNQFVVGAAKLMAVLGLHKEAEEVVAKRFAAALGSLVQNVEGRLETPARVKKTG